MILCGSLVNVFSLGDDVFLDGVLHYKVTPLVQSINELSARLLDCAIWRLVKSLSTIGASLIGVVVSLRVVQGTQAIGIGLTANLVHHCVLDGLCVTGLAQVLE